MYYIKKISKYLVVSVLIGILALLVTGCGADTGKNAVNKKNKPKITIGVTGTSVGYAEMSDDPSKNGGFQGFDVDLLTEIARRNNWDVEWKVGEFQALWGMIDNNSITTIAADVNSTPEREEKYYFTKPYSYSYYVFITKKGFKINDFNDLAGKKVAVEAAGDERTALENITQQHNISVEPLYLDNNANASAAFLNGTADALLASVKLAYSINDQLGVPVEIFNPEYRKHALCYPFKKTPENEKLIEQFNKTLDEMLKDGTVASYSQKWLKLDVTKF